MSLKLEDPGETRRNDISQARSTKNWCTVLSNNVQKRDDKNFDGETLGYIFAVLSEREWFLHRFSVFGILSSNMEKIQTTCFILFVQKIGTKKIRQFHCSIWNPCTVHETLYLVSILSHRGSNLKYTQKFLQKYHEVEFF